ncbi:MAG: DUF1254 domain-containing protein [Rubrivivax sp.]
MPRRTAVGLLALAALAVAAHVAATWAIPYGAMVRLLLASRPTELTVPYFPPMTDAGQRRVVLPSPDLLYATCPVDLRERPMRIRADPRLDTYWSIALYASNTDNYHVVNDRQAAGRGVELVLLGPQARGEAPAGLPPGVTVVHAPSSRGMLLMRVLVGDYAAEREAVEAARRTLRCEALGP